VKFQLLPNKTLEKFSAKDWGLDLNIFFSALPTLPDINFIIRVCSFKNKQTKNTWTMSSTTSRYLCVVFAVVAVTNILAPIGSVMGVTNYDRRLLRKYFKCPACEPLECPLPVGYPNCEMVLEPGVCACCSVCAKRAGERCGLGSGRCGKGLYCRPLPGDPDPLGAILSGRAACQ